MKPEKPYAISHTVHFTPICAHISCKYPTWDSSVQLCLWSSVITLRFKSRVYCKDGGDSWDMSSSIKQRL